ncbi:MAG: glycosyltransferase [Phycisphaerales bacterium]
MSAPSDQRPRASRSPDGTSSTRPAAIRAVHLPFDAQNPYQSRLFHGLGAAGVDAWGHPASFHPAVRQLTGWRADLVHFHWLHPRSFGKGSKRALRPFRIECFFAELAVLRARRTALVWTVHNLVHHESTDAAADLRFLVRLAAAVDACLVHSESARTEVLEAIASTGADPSRIASKLHVVPHGNYAGCYSPSRGREEQRARLGVRSHETLFAFVGQVRRYKNVVELVESFRRAASNDARLLIAGKPRDKALDAETRAAIGGDHRVIYAPGFVPDGELAANLEASDVVALPYRECLTSGAAILAMTFGKAIIAPNRGYFSEVLGPLGNPLYDDPDPLGLDGAIRRCTDDRANLEQVGMQNARAAATLDWNLIAIEVRRVYETALEQARHGRRR